MDQEVMSTAKAQLTEEGWCLLPGVLSTEKSASILERLWGAVEETKRRGVSTFRPKLDPNENNIRVVHLPDLDPVFCEMIENPVACEMVDYLLGPDYVLANFSANIARPGARSMALHSDQARFVPDPWLAPWGINIIWCLSDVTPENGATQFIPGSHKWKAFADIPPNPRSLLRPFVAKAGSIVVMESRLWHTSGDNITTDEDRALAFGFYTKSFIRSSVNWNVCLSESTKASLNPRLTHLLGLGPEGNVAVQSHFDLV